MQSAEHGNPFVRALSNIKISTKIISCLSILTVIICIIAGLSITGLWNVEEQFNRYSVHVDNTQSATDIATNVLEVRGSVARFMATSSQDDAETVETQLSMIQEDIEALKSRQTDGTYQKRLDTLLHEVDLYRGAFSRIVDLQTERDAILESKLNRFAPIMERQATFIMESAYKNQIADAAYHAGQGLRHLLLARLGVESYLLQHLEEQYETTVEEFKKTEKSVNSMHGALTNSNRKRVAKGIIRALTQYSDGFKEIATIIRNQDSIIKTDLSKIERDMVANIENLITVYKEQQSLLDSAVIDQVNSASRADIIWSIIGLIIAFAASALVILQVSNPTRKLAEIMHKVAGGSLDTELGNTERKDEIGEMTRSLLVFKDNAIERIRLEADQQANLMRQQIQKEQEEAEKAAQERAAFEEEERRRQETEEKRRRDMNDLADAFEARVMGVVDQVAGNASHLEGHAEDMSGQAATTVQSVHDLSQSATQASENMQLIASAAEEQSATFQQVVEQTKQSSLAAEQAVSQAGQTGQNINGLTEAADKIGRVIALIQEIAEQTNLLALNATIEAARAGDAGKGFAVVASEVKNLANQTANATVEITEQVANMQQATKNTVESINSIQSHIDDIHNTSSQIEMAMSEQNHATREIAQNVQMASENSASITDNMGHVGQTASQTGDTAKKLLDSAQTVNDLANNLRVEVNTFLAGIRTEETIQAMAAE